MLCAFISEDRNIECTFDTDSFRIIVDTGASAAFTFCKQDFISFTPLADKVKGLATLKIAGVGTVQYRVKNDQGETVNLTIDNCYYVPEMDIRLISPQQLTKQSTTPCMQSFDDKVFHLRWNGNTKTIPISKANNLPILHTAPGVSIACALAEAFHEWDPTLHCLKAQKKVPDYKADLQAKESLSDDTPTIPTHKMDCSNTDCDRCSYIKDSSKKILNHKRTLDDNETWYLRWHNQLGHPNFEHMKLLSKKGYIPRFIKCMNKEPVCLGCKLGKARLLRSKKGSITTDATKPGDLIHADQCESSQDGRPFTYSGQNHSTKVNYFTIFVDSVSKKVWVEFQTSTNTEQTLKGKAKVEKNAAKYNVTIKAYRTDNGTFRSKEFIADIEKCDQDITFCGVGAHGQNGMAERYIGTIVANARAMLLNASTHWDGEISTELWTFAVNYAVHTWNHTPRKSLDFRCPEEVFSGSMMEKDETRKSLEQLHTWGCPVYVLEEEIQNGQKPKRWDSRTRTGIFLGHSSNHSNSVYLILNPDTDRISPQYHCIFDDHFHTLHVKTEADKSVVWDGAYKETTSLVDLEIPTDIDFTDFAVKGETDNDHFIENFTIGNKKPKKISEKPKKGKRAKSPKVSALKNGLSFQRERRVSWNDGKQPSTDPSQNNDDGDDEVPDLSTVQDLTSRTQSTIHLKPVVSRKRRINGKISNVDCTEAKAPKTNASSKRTRTRTIQKPARYRAALAEIHELADKLRAEEKKNGKPFTFAEKIDRCMALTALDNGEINEPSPHLFAASVNPNILSHSQAKKAHDYDKFMVAMQEELDRMLKNEIFEEIPRHLMNKTKTILRAVWSHRRKTTPAGEIYRHRSRLCVDGSQQKEGIDYTETYSPVISWTTVRVLLILSVLLELKSKAVDYVQAFPQCELDEEDSVYMQIPDGYKPKLQNSVLKLKKNLYGLKQASHNWHNLLKAGLLKLGFKPSDYEPCLFLKDGIICVVYVDDTLFFAKDDKIIDNHISKLKKQGFELTEEGDVTAFLGVEISKDENGVITMTQTGLIDNIINLLGLKNESKQHKTPAVSPPLHTDTGGTQRENTWSYRSAIGMLIYLARNTRPDIEYAVHTCARFQLDPKRSHEQAVKRIGRYLLGTRDKGIVFKPDIKKLGELECFVDADFAGNYTKEQSQDPNSVRSRTGCVILYAGCPIIWFSKLQTEISLSTTEAEYIALSTACRELLPMREMFNELKQFLDILPLTPQVKCTLFEDNVGAETLAKSPKMTPRTKHIAIKYHHFRQAVNNEILMIERVDTKEQLADIFTKATTTQTFEYLRRKIMGWLSVFHPIKDKEEEEEFELFCNLSVFSK